MSNKPFAKIFESAKYGHICVIRQRDTDGDPAVTVFVEPPGLGVSSISMGWKDDDAGWDRQEKFFNEIALEYVDNWISSTALGAIWKAADEQKGQQ